MDTFTQGLPSHDGSEPWIDEFLSREGELLCSYFEVDCGGGVLAVVGDGS